MERSDARDLSAKNFNAFGEQPDNICLIFTLPFKALTLFRSLNYNRRVCCADMIGASSELAEGTTTREADDGVCPERIPCTEGVALGHKVRLGAGIVSY
jgi:hypothetical protein